MIVFAFVVVMVVAVTMCVGVIVMVIALNDLRSEIVFVGVMATFIVRVIAMVVMCRTSSAVHACTPTRNSDVINTLGVSPQFVGMPIGYLLRRFVEVL
ncbi:MAG: hypothetical protein ABIQ44_07865 [Chloroflexia bacterium]